MMTNTNGAFDFDQVVGGQMIYTQIGGIGPEWELDGSGLGLLNGDGKPAFLMRNTGSVANGQLYVAEAGNGSAGFTGIGGVAARTAGSRPPDFHPSLRGAFPLTTTGEP